ncbi:MAG: hypothetical protein ACE5I7_15685 [Candidatus Binatia bacterium]
MERKKLVRKSAATTKRTATKPRATKTAAARRKKTSRLAPPSPALAPRSPRRAVFIDVENTSGEAELAKVLEQLRIDRTAQSTELTALGNWRSIGARVARMLAGHGAQLVHSAPAVGVRDWSDLWIAVAAGRWLASAAPGDVLEIVSDDRAFDAVGDAAAAAGVVFRRLSYRALPQDGGRPGAAAPSTREPRSRARRRRSPQPPPAAGKQEAAVAAATPRALPQRTADEAAHAASHEQIQTALQRLAGHPERWITLDLLANTLRAEGFNRPPGSPRLITRLRRMQGVEVSPTGMVRWAGIPQESGTTPPVPHTARRPRRRGGRHRHRTAAPGAPKTPASPPEAPPERA